MLQSWIYTLISVIIISLISLIGIFFLSIKTNRLKKILIYMVSFSAGALFGDVFIHLLPEAVESHGFGLNIAIYVLIGIIFSFIIEKVVHWRHCHMPITKSHVHSFGVMNIFGDIVHNFIDGLIIGASFLASIPVGIATTIAIIFHEIPQEIGDFGVLLHAGFSRTKALFFNFLTALTAILGAVIALIISSYAQNITVFLVPFAAGTFIYIAGADLIPELHKECEPKPALLQLLTFIAGILVMMLLVLLG